MRKIALLFAATLSLPLAAGAQDSAEPVKPESTVPSAPVEQTAPPAATPDRAALRQNLAALKAQREAAVVRVVEARKAFQSSQVDLKIKASHLRSARAERDPAKAEALEKEIVPLRQEVRLRREKLRDALEEVKRLRAETRAAAQALGRSDAGNG